MKTVLVTGGTVRLGAAISSRLRADGWRVVTTSHRPCAGADLVADLSAKEGAVRLYSQVLTLLGRPPDALVNNAALFSGDAEILCQTNLESPRKLTMLMATRETGMGAVVNVLDCRAMEGEGDSAYLKTKCQLREVTKDMAATYAATLRVNGVAPGPILPPTGRHVAAGELLLERRPTPEDVADAVSFLLSNPAVTGTVIPVDAGQSLLLS